jgi:hypothetical protein
MKKLPAIQLDEDGRYFVQVAPNARIIFWMERQNGHDHHYMRLDLSPGTPVFDHPLGYDFCGGPSRN